MTFAFQTRHLLSRTIACGVLTAGLALAAAGTASAAAEKPAAKGTGPQTMSGLAISNDKPIQIESDSLKIDDKDKIATFIGNVKVVQGDTTMRAGKMVVHYEGSGSITGGDSQIQHIDIYDKVYVKSGDQVATADTGSYDMPSHLMTLSGKQVVLTQGDNVFVGCKLIVHVDTSQANLESCGKRVMIQLDPKSQKAAEKPASRKK